MPDYPDWMRVVGFFGQDPEGNLILIQVDDDGHLEIPLKGIFEGELVTIGVDEHGYLNAYILDDESQWGDIIKVGNAELASRLGSPITWDWRGKVQLMCDFSKGWQGLHTEFSNDDGAVALNPTYWRFGGYSAKLTTGGDGGSSAAMDFGMSLTPAFTVGLAVEFSVEKIPTHLDISIAVYKSEKLYSYKLHYLFATGVLEYRDSGGDWQPILTQAISVWKGTFYRMKLVVDIENDEYLRAMLGNQEEAIADSSTVGNMPGWPDYVFFAISTRSEDGDNDIVYIDHIIITADEPPNSE